MRRPGRPRRRDRCGHDLERLDRPDHFGHPGRHVEHHDRRPSPTTATSADDGDDPTTTTTTGEPAAPVTLRALFINVGNASPQFDCFEYKLCRPQDGASVRAYIAERQPDVIDDHPHTDGGDGLDHRQQLVDLTFTP